jgi:thiol-disulfide isomerase/thioredoxin
MASCSLKYKSALFTASLLVAIACASTQTPSHPLVSQIAEPSQGFRVEDGFVGSSVDIPAPGKVTVLDFWATWCAPCKSTVIPNLEKLWRKADRERVAVRRQGQRRAN